VLIVSTVEAAITEPVKPSLLPDVPHSDQDTADDQDGLESLSDTSEPRLSLPYDVVDDDSFQVPPRLSLPLGEDSYTVLSVERPRRDHTDLGQYHRSHNRVSELFANVSDTSNVFEDEDVGRGQYLSDGPGGSEDQQHLNRDDSQRQGDLVMVNI
jgi:hypothetical protein